MDRQLEIIKIYYGDKTLGRMVLSPENLTVFEYDPGFLTSGFSISPFYLPLRAGLFTARRDPFNGLFGVFNDSLPDGWGNLLIDRYLLSRGIKPQTLSLLDRLSIVGSSGMGALSYVPDKHIQASQTTDDLDQIAREIAKILSEIDYTTSLDIIYEMGASSGGARPKVLMNIKGDPWIVKFPSSYDPPDIGNIEYTYSCIAKKCGIKMPETSLFEGKYFGVRRFDREEGKRIHMHSASGLLYASHRYPSLDYIDLIKAALALTKNVEDTYQLFRLMVFNVLTGNKDDHAKNFSFICKSHKWQLSPAYDLVPSVGFNNNHSTTVAGNGNPGIDDIYKVSQETGLKERICKDIFSEVYENSKEIRIDEWK